MDNDSEAKLDLKFYLAGAVAAGLPEKAADSILELADKMVEEAVAKTRGEWQESTEYDIHRW